MTRPTPTADSALGQLLTFVAVVVVGVVLRAYVLARLWAWFVVPTFGLPALRLSVAAGLAGMVALFHQKPPKQTPEEAAAWSWTSAFGYVLLYNGLVLGCGYLVHLAGSW